MQVPGLTEIKARYILDYLQPKRLPEHSAEQQAGLSVVPLVRALAEDAQQLLSVDTGRLDERLSRQLARWVSLGDAVASDTVVAGRDQAKALEDLREARKAMSAIQSDAELKRKRQDRYAELLREPRRRLEKRILAAREVQ
jgi:hypothetical protein